MDGRKSLRTEAVTRRRQIAILSGYTEFVFKKVIERTTLKIEDRKIEDANCHGGFYIEKGCTKQSYKNHLQSIEQWPVNGLLANWWNDEQSSATTQPPKEPTDSNHKPSWRPYKKWMFETWEAEKQPNAEAFHKSLKAYKQQPKSIVVDWWNDSKDGPGIRIKSNNHTKPIKMKTIQNWVDEFKNVAGIKTCQAEIATKKQQNSL